MSSMKTAVLEAIVAAFPVAILYFSGWAYLTGYIGYFGIDATEVEIAFSTVLVYAFIPLKAWPVLCFLALAAVFGYYFTTQEWSGIARLRWAALGLVAAVAFLLVVKFSANWEARNMSDHVWRGAKSHTVAMVPYRVSDGKYHQLYRTCADQRRLRHIIGLPGRTYVLCRSAVTPCTAGTMFVINDEGRIIYVADKARDDDLCRGLRGS